MLAVRVVIKFGGADLSSGEKIQQAARLVAEAPFKEIVVVVSAMSKMTDTLIQTVSQIGVPDAEWAEIVSIGERTSARIFCAALRAQGLNAKLFDPAYENWPIITDSNFLHAKPILEKTASLTEQFVKPLLGTVVPVVCGFLGKDSQGRVTTLGRGGSDTTALLLANCISADEIILVKETSGVLSADPKLVSDARPLNKLEIHEMFDLAQGGAKIVKAEALKYKLPNQALRIVDFASGKLACGGTEIIGSFNQHSAEILTQEGLIAISVVCSVNAENITDIFSVLSKKPVYGVSSGRKSVTIFTAGNDATQILNKLHGIKGSKAITHRENVAMVQISNPIFIDSPGGIARISTALSQAGINIIEVTTSKATINVFIEESQIKRAKEAIENVV
ncbi:MAG: ACT domain-containing protein [Candidatus Bathyarchaeia archaeon]|jgi:aspartate kinase